MQWPLLKSLNFCVSSTEYCVGLTELGTGPQQGETRHSVRWKFCDVLQDSGLVGLDNGYVGVLSICEYMVYPIKGACMPCHCHDCGRSWELCLIFCGATAPTALPPHSAAYAISTENISTCIEVERSELSEKGNNFGSW